MTSLNYIYCQVGAQGGPKILIWGFPGGPVVKIPHACVVWQKKKPLIGTGFPGGTIGLCLEEVPELLA